MFSKKYDAIIIGAGLGGLTAACTLALNGKKVLLVEMHDKVGGFATNFKRKDFIFDVSLHNLGPLYENEILHKIFKELKILNEIKFLPFDEFQRIIFPHHDFIVNKGIEKYISFLKNIFPEEKNGIDKLFEIMISIRCEFDEIEKLDVTIDHLEEIYPMLPIKFPMLVKLVHTSFGELLDEHINDDELKGIIGNLWWIYGMPPEKVASILYSVPTVSYYNHAGGIIEGTSQKLSDSLAKRIKENKGEIFLNTDVKEIIVEAKKVKGILTNNNEYYYSDIVISNASAYETFIELIEENILDEKYRKKIEKLDLSLSGLQLYLGLDCDPSLIGIKNHNIVLFQTYDHAQNYKWILEGNYEKKFYCCTNYTAFDKTLAPEGKGVLNILSLDHIKNWENLGENEYKEKKKSVMNIIIKKFEEIYPKLSKHIEVAELATPITMKKYTRNPEGAIYGASQIIEQSGINRLTPETPIQGLYLVGAYVYPGAGYSSVISSGYKTGKMILEKIRNN